MKALAEALEGSEVSELDLTEDGLRVSLRRRLETVQVVTTSRANVRNAPSRARGRARADNANGASAAPVEEGVAIMAPLTGMFYTSSSPTSAPFVQIGGPVQAGQVVCIVEAMKVFNEITADFSGVVTAILPKNGQLVQKGEALIRVKSV